MELAFICIGIFVTYFIIVVRQYKKTTYYRDTKLPYLVVRYDVGRLGEYLTYKYLKKYV